MRSFDLGRRFDVITCLFSSIGYMKSPADLRDGVINMARHLQPGGVLIIEPWLTEETWTPGGIHRALCRQAGFQNRADDHDSSKGRMSVFEWHMLIGTPDGIEYLTQKHELFLFSDAEYIEAINAAGLDFHTTRRG